MRFGRPPKLTVEQVALGERLVGEGTSVRDAAKLLKRHHATLYRALSLPVAFTGHAAPAWLATTVPNLLSLVGSSDGGSTI